jgi:hypothetical protein
VESALEFVQKWPLQSLRGAEGAVAISTRRLLRFACNDVVKVKCNNSQAIGRLQPTVFSVWWVASALSGLHPHLASPIEGEENRANSLALWERLG